MAQKRCDAIADEAEKCIVAFAHFEANVRVQLDFWTQGCCSRTFPQ
jgi:hypothetical protein